MWAGTDDTVKMSLSGMVQGNFVREISSSIDGNPYWVLNDPTRNDHERNELCKFLAQGVDLEEILSCSILKDGRDDWELEYIKVIHKNIEYLFKFNEVIKGNKL